MFGFFFVLKMSARKYFCWEMRAVKNNELRTVDTGCYIFHALVSSNRPCLPNRLVGFI